MVHRPQKQVGKSKGTTGQGKITCRSQRSVEPALHNSQNLVTYVTALFTQGNYLEVEAIARQETEHFPQNGTFWKALGFALNVQGRAGEAVEPLQRAAALLPLDADVFVNLGNTQRDLGRLNDAEVSYRRALEIKPEYAEVHSNLGLVLKMLGCLAEAEACYRSALEIKPDYAEAHNNHGNTLKDLGRLPEAEVSYRRALEIKQDYADAHNNLGVILFGVGRLTEAEACCRRALEINPLFIEAHNNLALTLNDFGRLDEAEASFLRVLELVPDLADPRFNLSLLRLLKGDFERGLPEYELRWHRRGFSQRIFFEPLWLGAESLQGKTILLHAEQGLGDTIQFCRYARLVAARGARVVLEVQRSLAELLHGLEGVSEIVVKDSDLPHFDCHIPLISLPLAFKTDLTTIPWGHPYLYSDAYKGTVWANRLGKKVRPRVGIVWSGRPEHKNDHNRSLSLSELLVYLPDCFEYVSLQKEVREEDRATLLANPHVRHFGEYLNNFSDTAALCEQMDLVISVDTSVAHLSGALGKPTWILLSFSPDWRWLLDRDDSPWYPSVWLFRQQGYGEWSGVLQILGKALLDWSGTLEVQSTLVAECHNQTQSESAGCEDLVTHVATLFAHGNYTEIEIIARQQTEHFPHKGVFWKALGFALNLLGRSGEAVEPLQRAAALLPLDADVFVNLGNTLKDFGRLVEAEACYRRALEIKPDYAEVHSNLGLVLKDLGRLEEAEASYYHHALAIKPDYADARCNLGYLLLAMGRYREGWFYNESRYAQDKSHNNSKKPAVSYPQWSGESLVGKSLLLWSEQGFGDFVQFIRYVTLLKVRGLARLTVVCHAPLTPLLETMEGLDAVISSPGSVGPHDYWCFPLSLPHHFDTTVETIPASLPYLSALPSRISAWQSLLPTDTFKVGLVWKGSALHKNDVNRSLPELATLAPLWTVPHVSFVSLQKGQGEVEARYAQPDMPIIPLGSDITDLADTAAIVSQLDLVICVDTAVAHVAGALGKPCWVLLPAIGCDWRWLLDRTDSPWYPDVIRLFRQTTDDKGWTGVITDVVGALRGLVETHGTLVDVHQQLVSLFQLGRFTEGEAIARKQIERFPNCGICWKALGLMVTSQGRVLESLEALQRTVTLMPGDAEAACNLGNALNVLCRRSEAVSSYRRALDSNPDYADAHCNFGSILIELGHIKEAEACCRRALEIRPDYEIAYNNLGKALIDLGRLDEAEACYHRALGLKPDYAKAHFSLSLLNLTRGDYERGLPGYEWRWEAMGNTRETFMVPLWLGRESLCGKTILLHSEQGLGDTIQFCRYARLVAALGARVILGVPDSLIELFNGLEGVSQFITNGDTLPPFDFHTPLLSLPLACKTNSSTIPGGEAYLHSDVRKASSWAKRLGKKTKQRVGLVWSGSTVHKNDHNRSIPLAVLLHSLPDHFEFVSLQKEVREEDLATLLAHPHIRHFGEQLHTFSDTAALCDHMDLVVTVDTSVAHLSGALGKPTWILLSYSPDWRWFMEREDSPWYPSVKLFRQYAHGDWTGVVADISKGLTALAEQGTDVRERNVAEMTNGTKKQGGGAKSTQSKRKKTCVPQQGTDSGTNPTQKEIQQLVILYNQGGYTEGEGTARQLLERYPNCGELWKIVGTMITSQGRVSDSLEALQRGVELLPQDAEAHFNLGNTLKKLGRLHEAEACYRRALAINPQNADIHNNLGNTLKELGLLTEAETSFRRVLEIKPDYAEIHYNLGNTLVKRGCLHEAVASYRRAIEIKPHYAEAHYNLGNTLIDLGRLDECEASYHNAIDINPEFADAQWNLSFIKLLKGDFENGLPGYEWRWKKSGESAAAQKAVSGVLWLGDESLYGKTILLHSEQGLGDTIQFCRYARLVAALGARVIMRVHSSLKELLHGLEGVAELITSDVALPPYDFHIPLLSLPLAFKTTLSTIPGDLPYLRSDAVKVSLWADRLGIKSKRRVGIVWSGSVGHKKDLHRSIPLSVLITSLPDCCEYISLQKEVREDDRTTLLVHPHIRHFGEQLHDFSDTAALCELMDVILTVDTSMAHVSGALGKPTWILLPFIPDWRWLLERDDSPWYSSVRLFRQQAHGDWSGVLQKVTQALLGGSMVREHQDAGATSVVQRERAELTDSQTLIAQVAALFKQGNYQEIEIIARQQTLSSPQNGIFWKALGFAINLMGRTGEAVEPLRMAASLLPLDADVFVNLGNTHKELGSLSEAETCYRRALEIKPDYAEVYNNLGLILCDLDRLNEAEACYIRAIELKPHFVDARFNLNARRLSVASVVSPSITARIFAYAADNNQYQTGYQVHSISFAKALDKLMPTRFSPINSVDIQHDKELKSLISAENANENEFSISISSFSNADFLNFPGKFRIGFTAFEKTVLDPHELGRLRQLDQIWVPSSWAKWVLINNGITGTGIAVVPEGVDPDVYHPQNSPLTEFREDPAFKFLCVGKFEDRKGQVELIEAFISEFGSDSRVKLLLSTFNVFNKEYEKLVADYYARFKREGISNIVFLKHISHELFPSLYTSCDAFVLPTKAEGWGLPLIEAAASGLPLITTFYSGHTEFLDKDYIYEIDLDKMVDVFDAKFLLKRGEQGVWGQPSLTSIRRQLRYVFEHQAEAKEKGLRFSEIIRTKWSWDAAAAKARNVLMRISMVG